MRIHPRNKVPIWVLLVLVASLAIVCYVALELLREVHSEKLPQTVTEIGIELFKTVFIAVCIGAGVEVYLKHIMGDPSKEMLEKSGIELIYPARQDSADEFSRIINDKKTTVLYIAGISLRDFLTEQGNMHPVWNSICARLKNEEKAKLPEKRRLQVKLLLLDPRSSEGHFRHEVEEPLEIGKYTDIVQALIQVNRMQEKIYETNNSQFLQLRLYEHCPFSFLFLTKKVVFVEQYYYKDPTKENSLPLIKYNSDSSQYDGLRGSLETIWEHAAPELIKVGTSIPIEKARIRNIFREDNRTELTERQKESIENAQKGTVDILAISGNHYVNHDPTLNALLKIASQEDGKESTKVRFALVNPVSQQAILRAVADSHATKKIKESLCNWNWKTHKLSRLYMGVHQTVQSIVDLKKTGYSFELRLYSSSIACALLLASDSAFIEQYLYGRSKKLQGRQLLVREYPLIEYGVSKSQADNKTEQETISCTFEIVWEHYSITYDEYKNRKEEDEFNKNLSRLREELGCPRTDA